jgi:hypothetical protein
MASLFLQQRLNRFRGQHIRHLPVVTAPRSASVGLDRQTVERASPCFSSIHLHPEAKRNQACVGARGVAARSSRVSDDPPGADDKGIYPPKAFPPVSQLNGTSRLVIPNPMLTGLQESADSCIGYSVLGCRKHLAGCTVTSRHLVRANRSEPQQPAVLTHLPNQIPLEEIDCR